MQLTIVGLVGGTRYVDLKHSSLPLPTLNPSSKSIEILENLLRLGPATVRTVPFDPDVDTEPPVSLQPDSVVLKLNSNVVSLTDFAVGWVGDIVDFWLDCPQTAQAAQLV